MFLLNVLKGFYFSIRGPTFQSFQAIVGQVDINAKSTNQGKSNQGMFFPVTFDWINTKTGICPLTKKWAVYNFNGRFIWIVRDEYQQKFRKIAFKKSYKLICILMSQISIWSLRKTGLSTWWQNPCWQSQRSDVSCSWPPGLHTSQEGFCPTPLCRSSPSH